MVNAYSFEFEAENQQKITASPGGVVFANAYFNFNLQNAVVFHANDSSCRGKWEWRLQWYPYQI